MTLGGRSFEDFLDLALSCPVITSPKSKENDSKPNDNPATNQLANGKHAAELYEEHQIMAAIGLVVLGTMTGGGIKVFSQCHRRTSIIDKISNLSYESLLNLCGPIVKARVQKVNVDDIPGVYSLVEVRQAIALLAGFVTITEKTELGIGIWQGKTTDGHLHEACVLVSSGEAAELNGDGKLKRITEPRCRGHLLDFDNDSEPWFEFDKLSRLIDRCDETFARDTRDALVQLFQKWKWTHELATPLVLAGLVFSSWVQSLWDWRPQVAVVGPSNAGKSTLCNCLAAIFGNLCMKSSKSTAAGLRQNIRTSSKIILCDEFEHSTQREEILEMLRASGRGDVVYRGTTSQKAQGFSLRHICWVAAIEVGLNRACRSQPIRHARTDEPRQGQARKACSAKRSGTSGAWLSCFGGIPEVHSQGKALCDQDQGHTRRRRRRPDYRVVRGTSGNHERHPRL